MNTDAPILLATDGTPGSLGAVRAAGALARLKSKPVVAVAVVEPVTAHGTAFVDPVLMLPSGFTEGLESVLRNRVSAQLDEAGLEADRVAVEVVFGPIAPSIVHLAAEHGADMIVLGLGRHDVADRWLGTETALRVVHLSHVPVLAVHPDAKGLPRRALVAVDFSVFSRDAAAVTAELLADQSEMHLGHVAWSVPSVPELSNRTAWIETYRVGARTRLDEMRRELTASRPLRTFTTLLEGEIPRALLKYATMCGADLISTGSHGYGFLGRMMMGSVSTRLLRQAPCSVLVAPPHGVVELEPPAAGAETVDSVRREPVGTA